MLQTSANPTRRINASSGFYYAVPPSFAGRPFILVRCPYQPAYVRTCARLLVRIGGRRRLPGRDLESLSHRGLNHLSGGGGGRKGSVVPLQGHVQLVLSIYRRGAVRRQVFALRGRCSRRPRAPRRAGILMGMQMALGLATSADIDPPADLRAAWQMDCHLWMRADWDTSPLMSLSGGGEGFGRRLCSLHLRVSRFIHPLLSPFSRRHLCFLPPSLPSSPLSQSPPERLHFSDASCHLQMPNVWVYMRRPGKIKHPKTQEKHFEAGIASVAFFI